MKQPLSLVLVVTVTASPALAQQAPQPAPTPAEPVLLTLPMGSQVRLQTKLAPGQWTKGILVSADAGSVAMVPEGAPPLGANQLRLPVASVGRFELKTGSKRQWLYGLLIGAALGVAIGATVELDPAAACAGDEYYYFPSETYICSRGEAIAYSVLGSSLLGVGIGALIKTDRWTPVALDALAPPPARVSGIVPRLRAGRRGGVELGLAVGF